jgi:hypothetical protein
MELYAELPAELAQFLHAVLPQAKLPGSASQSPLATFIPTLTFDAQGVDGTAHVPA